LPVDINEDYLKIASRAAEPFANKVLPINDIFSNCYKKIPDNINFKRFVFIGLTFMNFEPEIILNGMAKIAGEGGSICIATELISATNKIEDIEKHYKNSEVEKFSMGPLLNLNVNPDALKFDIRFKNGRIEIGFIIKSEVKELGFHQGDRFISGVSYRYTAEELSNVLDNTPCKSEIWISGSEKVALAVLGSE